VKEAAVARADRRAQGGRRRPAGGLAVQGGREQRTAGPPHPAAQARPERNLRRATRKCRRGEMCTPTPTAAAAENRWSLQLWLLFNLTVTDFGVRGSGFC